MKNRLIKKFLLPLEVTEWTTAKIPRITPKRRVLIFLPDTCDGAIDWRSELPASRKLFTTPKLIIWRDESRRCLLYAGRCDILTTMTGDTRTHTRGWHTWEHTLSSHTLSHAFFSPSSDEKKFVQEVDVFPCTSSQKRKPKQWHPFFFNVVDRSQSLSMWCKAESYKESVKTFDKHATYEKEINLSSHIIQQLW